MAIRKRTGKKGVTWQIDYYDPNGKRVRANYRLKKDAEAELGKRVSLMAEGRYLDVKKECEVTLTDIMDKYTREYGDQNIFPTKQAWFENFKDYFGASRKLDTIKYMDVQGYQTHLKNKLTCWEGIRRPSSINREMSCLRHLFAKAREWDIIESSPFDGKKSLHLTENNARDRYLDEKEICRLLATSMPDWLRNLIVGILHTGMRRQEVLGLQWHQVRDGFIYLRKTKTNKSRQIPIDNDLGELLRTIRRQNGLRSQYVFSGPSGEEITALRFSQALTRLMKRANIDDCTCHTLRHTFASHFCKRQGNLRTLQKILGHKKPETTARYTHLSSEFNRQEIEKMNGLTTGQNSDQRVTNHSHQASLVSHVSHG